MRPHRWQPIRLHCPWNSPGKNTGVGCHFLLQCRKVKSESEVTQSCPTLSDPMDCSPPGSSLLGIFQARVLEWGAIAFSTQCCVILTFFYFKTIFIALEETCSWSSYTLFLLSPNIWAITNLFSVCADTSIWIFHISINVIT